MERQTPGCIFLHTMIILVCRRCGENSGQDRSASNLPPIRLVQTCSRSFSIYGKCIYFKCIHLWHCPINVFFPLLSRLESKCSLLRQSTPEGTPAPLERSIQAMELPCCPLGPVGEVVYPRPLQEVLVNPAWRVTAESWVKGYKNEEARYVKIPYLCAY